MSATGRPVEPINGLDAMSVDELKELRAKLADQLKGISKQVRAKGGRVAASALTPAEENLLAARRKHAAAVRAVDAARHALAIADEAWAEAVVNYEVASNADFDDIPARMTDRLAKVDARYAFDPDKPMRRRKPAATDATAATEADEDDEEYEDDEEEDE